MLSALAQIIAVFLVALSLSAGLFYVSTGVEMLSLRVQLIAAILVISVAIGYGVYPHSGFLGVAAAPVIVLAYGLFMFGIHWFTDRGFGASGSGSGSDDGWGSGDGDWDGGGGDWDD